jgi:hypothetical protein
MLRPLLPLRRAPRAPGSRWGVDVVVEKGNPADTTLAQKMVERVGSVLGRLPKQVSFDGGFSSKANVTGIKKLGVTDVAFSKHVGLNVSDMATSPWVFRKLRSRRYVRRGTYLPRAL